MKLIDWLQSLAVLRDERIEKGLGAGLWFKLECSGSQRTICNWDFDPREGFQELISAFLRSARYDTRAGPKPDQPRPYKFVALWDNGDRDEYRIIVRERKP